MGASVLNFLQSNRQGIDIGSTALGGGLEFAGQLGNGIDAQNQSAYKAAVLRNNALIANENARAALERGQIAAQEKQVETQQTIGLQKATLAAHGIVVNQDTGLDLSIDAARLGKLDELTILRNAEREALAYKMQGINFTSEAKAAKSEGRSGMLAGLIGGAGTLINTASTVASKWALYSKENEKLGTS